MSYKILIADDEPEIRSLLRLYLENEKYEIIEAEDGQQALELLRSQQPALCILDIMMPKLDGYHVLQELRKESNIPVLILSAKDADSEKILGLNLGADDYLAKPFNPLEVVARIKTQLRRYRKYNSGEQPTAQEYDIRGLTINRESHRCVLYGNELQLTPIEFSILWYLCERKGKVVPSEELFEAVWKEKYMNSNNTVMAHIARLREKMHEPARSPKFIKTVWGVGYTIE